MNVFDNFKMYLMLSFKCFAFYFVANIANTYIFNNETDVIETIADICTTSIHTKFLSVDTVNATADLKSEFNLLSNF